MALSMAAGLQAASGPPVHDSIQLSTAVLLKGETLPQPEFSGEFTKVAAKFLPSSINLYLKPSSVIDSKSVPVLKAAKQALALMGGGLQKQTLEDPRLLAAAVRAWVALNLAEEGESNARRSYATDPRFLIPKASAIIKLGQTDQAGRVRVRLAMLRALGVPARPAWFRGLPAVQYWAHWIDDAAETPRSSKSAKKAAAPSQPKGEWVLDETMFAGEGAESWSMDSGDLAPALWKPEQEFERVALLERSYFEISQTAAAMAAMAYIKENGALPLSLAAKALPPRKGAWLMVANQRTSLSTEGSMEALQPLEILLPYRPRLASWGSQARPRPDALETLDSAFWTNRPDRVRLKKNNWVDEYKSPPPAYGVLHYASLGLRKPPSVIEAAFSENRVSGKLLRRDSLAPRPSSSLRIEYVSDLEPQIIHETVGSSGTFDLELKPTPKKGSWIKVSGGIGNYHATVWDTILIKAE